MSIAKTANPIFSFVLILISSILNILFSIFYSAKTVSRILLHNLLCILSNLDA